MGIFSILADLVSEQIIGKAEGTGADKADGLLEHIQNRQNEKEGSYDSSTQKDPTKQQLDKIIDMARERDKLLKELSK